MEISQIQVSVDDVTKHLVGLDTSKACGPDGIPARLLKECSQQIPTEWGFSYVRWKPRNEQLAQMGSFHQSKRSDNKQYAVEVRWGIFFWEFDVFFYSLERS